MKKLWGSMVLRAFVIGTEIVLALMGAGAAFGARFGPCGPTNTAAAFLMVAMMPGYFLVSWIPVEGNGWVQEAFIYPAAVLAYALPVGSCLRSCVGGRISRWYVRTPGGIG